MDYNIKIDSNLLDELKRYVSEEKVGSMIEKLIRSYIKQKKQLTKTAESDGTKIANKNKMTKKKAVALFSHKNYDLHLCVTFASTNASREEFWANPNVEFLKHDWSFILNDTKKRKLYLLNIPKNTFTSKDFPHRNKGKMLAIALDTRTLINVLSDKTDFSPYKIAEVSY